jgi:ABC-type polysaccharide/polyol phosphate transport system ATPase subunit
MYDSVITVEKLSKHYLVGHRSAQRESRATLRDVIVQEAANFVRKAVDVVRGRQIVQGDEVEEFWALNDVSFEVKRGEVLGIIGRNGAGKSTLLKILSRITEPTKGKISLKGRVASLLEVGTGFHAELTGRENIFLNGAILGMTREEVRKKFDEIVAFAEIEQFLDTPVKRYSSGMYVRLAFAVAAHLEPEILIVDEVLAVGDAEFQKKCLGKLQNVAQLGRTVLFVSHDLDAVERLSSRCILLSGGTLALDGPTENVVTEYLRGVRTSEIDFARYRSLFTPNTVSIQEIWTEANTGERSKQFRQGEPFRIGLRVSVEQVSACDLAITVNTSRQHTIFTTHLGDLSPIVRSAGPHTFYINIDHPTLRRGDYLLSFAAFSSDHKTFYELLRHMPGFQIEGTFDKSIPNDTRDGDIYVPIKWQVVPP